MLPTSIVPLQHYFAWWIRGVQVYIGKQDVAHRDRQRHRSAVEVVLMLTRTRARFAPPPPPPAPTALSPVARPSRAGPPCHPSPRRAGSLPSTRGAPSSRRTTAASLRSADSQDRDTRTQPGCRPPPLARSP